MRKPNALSSDPRSAGAQREELDSGTVCVKKSQPANPGLLPETLKRLHKAGKKPSKAKKLPHGLPTQVILPTVPGMSNALGPPAGCFLALGSSLGLVGTASSRR